MSEYKYPDIAAMYLNDFSAGKIAAIKGLTRNQVVGRLTRMGLMGTTEKERGYVKPKSATKRVPGANSGCWDTKAFEPYAVRKERLAMERANGLR